MDELDQALLEAWGRVSAALADQPWALARRIERVSRKELRRPVRAWCVALRASDARIGAEQIGSRFSIDCWRSGRNHRLVLRGKWLRRLCRPVRINWPGVPVSEAAALLGRDERTVWSWVKKGVFEVDRQGAVGRRGQARHLVWSARALDPQADDGRGPWEAWGTLWQGLAERIPEGLEQRVERVARVRHKAADAGGQAGAYRGWDWVCPGRVLATGQRVACGRVCKKLWLPLPVWTVGDALGDRAGSAWERLPRFDAAGSSFACARCWGMRFDPVQSEPAEAWNRFVSVVSGGLLYGREVRSPASWRLVKRKDGWPVTAAKD